MPIIHHIAPVLPADIAEALEAYDRADFSMVSRLVSPPIGNAIASSRSLVLFDSCRFKSPRTNGTRLRSSTYRRSGGHGQPRKPRSATGEPTKHSTRFPGQSSDPSLPARSGASPAEAAGARRGLRRGGWSPFAKTGE